MDNIEKALDNFFQRLGHTPGPWEIRYPSGIDMDIIPKEGPKICFFRGYSHSVELMDEYQDKEVANANLVSHSPDMLRTLCRTYLHLLTNTRSLYLPEILVPLRDQVSAATGIESHEIERTFTQYATWIELGADPTGPIKSEPADQRDPETKVFSAMQGGTD